VSSETTSSGSLEIYLNTDNYIGASIVTSHSGKSWPRITAVVSDHWHHLVMTYDGKTINFYHNNHLKLTDSECCHGNIVSRNSDVVIGHSVRNYAYGYHMQDINSYIDEMKLFKKALTAHEVLKLYQLKVV
jgi:alkaline phosphatase